MKKRLTICALLLAWLPMTSCDGSADSDTSCKDGEMRCKSADSPSLAQICRSKSWEDVDLSQVADIEASVCVVINGKTMEKSICPGETEGSHAAILPWESPVCAVAECAKDDRDVLYTDRYSQICETGGAISDNACDCGSDEPPGTDKPCTDGEMRCKSADSPSLAQICRSESWEDVDLSQVVDKEAGVCVVINGKTMEKSICPGDTEGSHATLLPWMVPICAVAECVKDERGVLFTARYSKQCKRGGTITGNTCDCGTED